MKKLRFITAVQITILFYLVFTSKSINAKIYTHNLFSVDSLYKGYKINHDGIKINSKLSADQLKKFNEIELKQSVDTKDSKITIGLNNQLYTNELPDNNNIMCKTINKNSTDFLKESKLSK